MKKEHCEFNKILLLTVACSIVLLFSGCQSHDISLNNVDIEANQSVDEKITENNGKDADTPVESELFSDVSKYQFVFSSGAGAWQTILTINEDGTFSGEFSDADMGWVEEDHPNGVIYSSTFEGKFTEPTKVNDYTYSMQIEYINLEKEVGTEEIIDGVKYIYSEPYGINDAEEILIYTPEAPVKELPEGFRYWVGLRNLDDLKDEHLGYYGLYNVKEACGFSSYKLDGAE